MSKILANTLKWVEAQYAQFEPEIMLDGMFNFETHFMV